MQCVVIRKSGYKANRLIRYFSMFVSLNFKSFATLSVSLSRFEVNAKNLLISSHCWYARKPCSADWVCLLLCFHDCKNPLCLSCLGLQITLKALHTPCGDVQVDIPQCVRFWGFSVS